MRITAVNIEKTGDDGLEAIKMERLGQVVLLAGKNGAGKTRILNKIKRFCELRPYDDEILLIKQRIKNNERTIINAAQSNHKPYVEGWRAGIKQEQERLSAYDKFEVSDNSKKITIIPFSPNASPLTDPEGFNKHQIISYSKTLDNLGFNGKIEDATSSKIQDVQNKWYSVNNPMFSGTSDEKADAIFSYEALKNLVYIFLQANLDRDVNDNTTIFGFPLSKAKLSQGQNVLLKLCIAIFAQQTNLKDTILFMDEPENHIHPAILIETIDSIRNIVTDGQIWIATHSLPLIAHLNTNEIHFVEDGRVSYAGKTPEKVINSLLGGEDNKEKLYDFLGLPAQLALNQFATECLFSPDVVTTNSSDPQSNQIRDIIAKLPHEGKLRILDFGAGKERILANIAELDKEHGTKIIEKIDYYAYDESPSHKDECDKVIASIYSTEKLRYFSDWKTLSSNLDENTFDIVIMCNVLHEIPPKEWAEFFGTKGKVTKFLKDTGYLLTVESQILSIGENAYKEGFMVFDTTQFKKLFSLKEGDVISDPRKNGELKAHLISKKHLSNFSSATQTEAIQSLQDEARLEIKKIRNLNTSADYKLGKKHAFWMLQYANASLYLGNQS